MFRNVKFKSQINAKIQFSDFTFFENLDMLVRFQKILYCFEISETNNEYSSSVQVLPLDTSTNTGVQQDSWMANLPSGAIWIVAASIILGAIIALQLGPGKIRREI